jgi:hypothetical protein
MYLYDEHNQVLTYTRPNGDKFVWRFRQCGYSLTIQYTDNTSVTFNFDNEHNMRTQ